MNKYELFLNYFYEVINYLKDKFDYIIDFCNSYNLINFKNMQIVLALILFICLLKLIRILKNLNNIEIYSNNNSYTQYKISFKTINSTYISLNFTFNEIMNIFLNSKAKKKNIYLSLYKNTYINLWDNIVIHNGVKFILDERNGNFCHINCFIDSLGNYKNNFMKLLETNLFIKNNGRFYLLKGYNETLKKIDNFKINEINNDKAKLNIIVNIIEEIEFNISNKEVIKEVREFFNR